VEKQPVLIICYGDTLHGDDGLGWHVADQMARRVPPDEVLVIACQQLTPELAESVREAQAVILVDAAPGETPGRITCQQVVYENGSNPASNQHLTPGELLACTRAQYGTAPPMWLWTITGESFEACDELSPVVQDAVLALVQILTDQVAAPA
jgi:hydrogenase maturation protease